MIENRAAVSQSGSGSKDPGAAPTAQAGLGGSVGGCVGTGEGGSVCTGEGGRVLCGGGAGSGGPVNPDIKSLPSRASSPGRVLLRRRWEPVRAEV
jgi:hypothetical protein